MPRKAVCGVSLQQELKQLSPSPKRIIKVIILGNTGRGKSLLNNICLGSHVFVHKYQPQSCTSRCSYAICMVGDIAYVFCDLPGLLEANASMISRNEQCIEEATRVLPGSEMLLIFVMRVQISGRMCSEDIEAHRAVLRFLPSFPATARGVVVNGLSSRRFKTKDAEDAYILQMKDAVHGLIHPDLAVCFTPFIEGSHDDQLDFTNPEVRATRQLLLAFLSDLQPAVATPGQGAKVELDSEKLQREIDELQQKRVEIEILHKQELENNRKQMEARIAAERQELQRQLDEARRRAEESDSSDDDCSIM